jgi:hypothetical protein
MLVKGSADEPLRPGEIRHLPCSDSLKEIIQRCIGARGKRLDTADELIKRLGRPQRRIREGHVESLRGQVVVFTGRLSLHRKKASDLARRSGAIVAPRVTARTNVVVYGESTPWMIASSRGKKLIDVGTWRERGVDMKIIYEPQFLSLVHRSSRSSRR